MTSADVDGSAERALQLRRKHPSGENLWVRVLGCKLLPSYAHTSGQVLKRRSAERQAKQADGKEEDGLHPLGKQGL